MSYAFYQNSQKNMFSNENLNFGKTSTARVNYHYLQKEREKAKEMQNSNMNNNKAIIPPFLVNNNVSLKNEENKKNIFNPQNRNYNEMKNENKYNNRNRSFHDNNFSSRNRDYKYGSYFIQEKEKSQKAKELMDNFDKRLYDTNINFAKDIKPKNNEEIKSKEKPYESTNNQRNTNINRNLSYDKYNYNNNTLNKNNNPNSTLRNTDYLYKNYFQNNNYTNNIHRINPNSNELSQKENNKFNNIYSHDYYRRNSFRKLNYKIKNFSSYSLAGTDISRKSKTNQDSFLTKNDLNNYIFGVFDGHGMDGHLISQAIKNYINKNANTNTFSSNERIISLFNNLSNSINSSLSFKAMDSGSTAVITFINNEKIICANCGDSRAILISENENKIIPLSRDHKPELPDEKKRIIMNGGRVDKIFGMGPYRVWFKDAEYPGLAMSRSIGDGYAHKIGVIHEPEIFDFNLNNARPKAIILASDGVFEFVKNEEIKDIVEKYFYNMDSQGCAKDIVEYSRKIWENSGYAIDDITCIVAFFELI